MEARIYYEDTDAGGVVYHANYLRYLERGRTEYFRELGLSVKELHEAGVIFPVVAMELNFRAPARLDDLLWVETFPVSAKNSSFVLNQRVLRKEDGKLLVEARVTLACVGEGMRARRIPAEVKALFPG
jgi:acyl-CoA thioester hydrolase